MKRKTLFLLLIFILCLVSCSVEKTYMVTGPYKSNPFLNATEVMDVSGEEVSLQGPRIILQICIPSWMHRLFLLQ